jgi:hypothetical protein
MKRAQFDEISKQVDAVVMLWTYIRKVLGLNVSQDTNHPEFLAVFFCPSRQKQGWYLD